MTDSLRIDADVDASGLIRKLALTEKNVAFATVNAINDTLKQVQDLARQNLRDRFTLRKPDFMLRQAAIIRPFANIRQARPFGEVAVGQKARLLLSTFEEGGEKRPFKGKRVAVPITGSPARPTFGAPVPQEYRVSALRLRKQKAKPRGRAGVETVTSMEGVWRGQQRTYMIPDIGIFQRFGPGKADTRLLYYFDSDVPLPRKLGFLAMAKSQGQALFRANLESRLVKEVALRAARGK